MKRWLRWTAALGVALLLAAFAGRAIKARQHTTAAATAAASAAAPVLDVSADDLLVARRQELARTLAITGSLKAVTSAVVKAKVASEVKSLSVREGDAVKAGQVIGQLDTTEFDWRIKQAEQSALAARTQLDIATRALANNQALVAQGFISPTALETSVSSEAGAQATYQAALAATEIARKARADSVLVAPISGIVSQRLAQPGERLAVDAKVIEVVDLSRIELEAAVAPEDVGAVQVGQTARLSVDGLRDPAVATVARINPSTQAGTRAVMVYLALQPQAGLRQGLFARGSIELARKNTLVVPVSAVRVDQARPYVLAVQAGRVAQRAVELGLRGEALVDGRIDAAVELSAGVTEGAMLLRGTAGTVRDGTPVKLPGAAAAPAAAGTASAAAR